MSGKSCSLLLSFALFLLLGCGGPRLPKPRLPDDDPPAPRAARNNATPEGVKPSDEPVGSVATPESSGSENTPVVGSTIVSRDSQAAARKAQSIANLRQIGAAMAQHIGDKRGRFPPPAMISRGSGTLSWRVALLPYMGQQKLYERFEPKESWGGSQNKRWLPDIPAMYRSHPTEPTKTNYVVLTGPGTVFEHTRATDVRKITDGLANTVIMVELKDDYENVPHWTEPKELPIDEFSLEPLAIWDNGGFLALTAAGQVVQIRTDIPLRDFIALTTIAGDEPVSLSTYTQALTEPLWDINAGLATANDNSPSRGGVATVPVEDDDNSTSNLSSSGNSTSRDTADQADATDRSKLSPIPAEAEQRVAMELVKELFLKRYQAADNSQDKKQVAREMLTKSKQLGQDVAGKYVMLTTVQRIALEVNDIETAGAALQALMSTYDFDAYAMKVELLRKSSSLTQKTSFDTKLMDEAKDMMDEALARDDYAVAVDMADVALSAARRLNDKDESTDLARRQREVQNMARVYAKVKADLARVDGSTTADPEISESVGRYYCLMKGDWKKGLPYLAQADDADLRRLAQRDLQVPDDPQLQLALADGWWAKSESHKSPEDEYLRRRAGYWYSLAIKNLPQGLARLKAEVRVKELDNADKSKG